MAEIMKQILTRPVQLADHVSKTADEAIQFRADCMELKSRTTKLAELLRQAARSSSDLYERPTRRIMDDTNQALEKAVSLVNKCRARSCFKRVFTIIPNAAFRKTFSQLDNSIGDVTWLLRVSSSATANDDDDDCDIGWLGLPPIAANEPILCLIWEHIANLSSGSLGERADAAASLVSLARDNDRYGKLIIEEGGVGPLLKLVKEGKAEGQENAARALGLLGRDQESVEQIVSVGVCAIFAKILKEGHMKVQVQVAGAVSSMARNNPKCQDHFAQNNVIRLLVSHLAFETIPEHSKYTIMTNRYQKMSSLVMTTDHNKAAAVGASDNHDDGGISDEHLASQKPEALVSRGVEAGHDHVISTGSDTVEKKLNIGSVIKGKGVQQMQSQSNIRHRGQHHHHPLAAGSGVKARESEDPVTKARMKAMASEALWHLASGNVSICRSICESRALLCFAVLMENGADEDIRFNSSMALMEITAVAEENSDLRRTAFKPTTPAAKAVVDQLLKIVTEANSELLVQCIRSLGHLARTFRETETRILGPLVKLLDDRESDVMVEAVVALVKFACTENYLHGTHCRTIIEGGGVKHLIQLIYFEEQMVQVPSLILLCYVALHVPESQVLAQEEVIIVFEWAMKQNNLMAVEDVEMLLPEAKGRLELYQSRRSRGFGLKT